MDILNCTWEIANLGKNTIEILVDTTDSFNSAKFEGFDAEYIVVKVPTGKVDYCLGLPKLGFALIESQFRISKFFSSFDFENPLIRSFNKKTTFSVVQTKADLEVILNRMTPMMFRSDRICLDPMFGPIVGLKRYKNWMISEFDGENSTIIGIINRGILVGFSMFRTKNDICDVLLGGIFEDFQNKGLGFLTPISPVLYMTQNGQNCRLIETSISSNNFSVIEFYNYLNYKLDKITNIFVKHQNT